MGPWALDISTFTLDHDDYQVDLEQCTTSTEVLDWIAQIATKQWATNEVIAGLVRAINDVLAPQANLCSGGKHLTLTGKQIRQPVRAVTP